MTDAPFHDDLTMPGACADLWSQVLMLAISDALNPADMGRPSLVQRMREIQQARDDLTIPNRDFNEVCRLAGLDPEAVRERAAKLIAAAPSVEILATTSQRRRGVVCNFAPFDGTGGGSTAQETPEITFSEKP